MCVHQLIVLVCFLTCIGAWYVYEDDAEESNPVMVKPTYQKRVTVGSAQVAGGQEGDVPLPSAKGGKRKRVGKIVGIL